MNAELLVERRRWFRIFPEGTLEFAVITRVLMLAMLLALAIVGGTHRPLILLALIVAIWVDYALLVWWTIQVVMDLRAVVNPDGPDAGAGRVGMLITSLLPSMAAVLGLVPWANAMMVAGIVIPAGPLRLLPTAAGVAFVVLLIPAYRTLRRLELGSSLWTALMLVPIIHWLAIQRISARLERQIVSEMQARGHKPRTGGMALAVADVTWVLSILPWAIVAAYSLTRGWPSGTAFKIVPVCGTMLTALFAIANLATVEGTQRQIVSLLRKAT